MGGSSRCTLPSKDGPDAGDIRKVFVSHVSSTIRFVSALPKGFCSPTVPRLVYVGTPARMSIVCLWGKLRVILLTRRCTFHRPGMKGKRGYDMYTWHASLPLNCVTGKVRGGA